MAQIPIFSNKPRFCQKPLTIDQTLSLPFIDVVTETNFETSSQNYFGEACGDPNLGTTFIKNIIHQVIRCGGKPMDLNFFMDVFGSDTRSVETKQWFNHYVCDIDMNIYAAASVVGAGPGLPATFQLLKQNHAGGGTLSLPSKDYILMDKDNMIEYTISNVDTTTDYSHKITVIPNSKDVTVNIRGNKPYLVIPTRMVGGYSCPVITNKANTIGYTQVGHPIRLRSDWEVEIDLLRGYPNKLQYAIIYDYEGNPHDAWDVFEAQEARQSLRIGLNVLAFIGTPTTNPSLISGLNATIDSAHTGFYGLLPSIKYGGGVVYDYRSSVGFDLESDGEPLFLYQDSLKRTKKFLLMHGLGFSFGLNNRTNKMVARSQVGATIWEGYKRLGELTGEEYMTEVAKLGVKFYDYMGFQLDMKLWDAMSDQRFIGSNFYSNLATMIPQDGPTEGGQPINPIEFYQYGYNGWTGDYYEEYIDYRKVNGCEKVGGYAAQSLGMVVHCPQLYMILNPVTDA